MAYCALLWKARTIENYRHKYEKEKINSIVLGNAHLEQTLSRRWRCFRCDTKKRITRLLKKLYPDGSVISNFFLYLMTDQTFPNFLLKSVMGFVGGIILTYLCFMFFVFQLAISLIHATIMSSIIGVLLTLGLAFSYRIRCLVFLLIPQFFSRVGRYTLTCYALVLILTGPATNTLKNSEVLSESMACSQEQIKTSVHQLNDLMKKPINAMKDSLKLMVDQLKMVTAKVKETMIRLDRLVLSIVATIQSSFSWLQSVADICNVKLGTPYDRCCNAIQDGYSQCQKSLGPQVSELCDVAYVAQAVCYSAKPFKAFCYATDFIDEAILASVRKKLRDFTEHLSEMFHVEVHIHHSYSYSSNTSRSASQVAAGIVTEIRNRADPMLTWLSWSSCVTSLFLLLIIFRAKYYQHMYETRSRFDNRYVTKELQALDLKRQQQGKETVLPLNRRERAKYITPSSFNLVASEKVYLNRSAVFMAITTFKLLIHMIADYSLYWVLMTIRCHGKYQSDLMPGIPHSGAHVSGSGFAARLFRSIIGILDIPLSFPSPSPISCLPDPYPPDLRRYTQIGVLIFLLWFFALFEPYGLRLRHLIMGHYRPERAKARATWLYNHILRTRASFMKFARRKLHREYKYSSEASLTFRQWLTNIVPFQCLRSLVGLGPRQQHCLLCGITSFSDPDSRLTKCQTPGCPGVFCISCFTDIGELCTICLSPADYGDLSDVSLEKGSSDDSDSDGGLNGGRMNENITFHSTTEINRTAKPTTSKDDNRRWTFFKEASGPRRLQDSVVLFHNCAYKNKRSFLSNLLLKQFQNLKRNMKRKRCKKDTFETKKDISKKGSHKVLVKESSELDVFSNRTQSIGVNTDRNRGILLGVLSKSFFSRKEKQSRSKRKKAKRDQKHKKPPMRRIKKRTNSLEDSSKKSKFSKSFQSLNFTIRQRNLKCIVRNKKDSRTHNRMKGYERLKGIMRAIRYFVNGDDSNKLTNQNNDNAPANSLNEDGKKITKATDTANFSGKKNKKECSKNNKPKKTRKQKDVNKIKTKNSRHRIAEFHKFFSNHWNNFKSSIMPDNAHNRSDVPMPKEKKNHKRRKKRKPVDCKETDIEQFFARKDIKHTRNLRISAFLAELEWTKRDFKKEKDIEEEKDSFLQRLETPAPKNTNKIVGMVQLRSLPFQWREAPKTCMCGKNCACPRKQSCTKLFVTLSQKKLTAKRAIDRFRHKVHTVMESPASTSMVPRVSTSIINGARGESPIICESSICLSKRTSLYRSFNPRWSQHSDILNTDLLFENTKYGNKLMQDPFGDIPSNLSERSSNLSSVLGKDIVVSRNSLTKEEEEPIKRCKCDVLDDLQRKWGHVKKSFTDLPGTRNPLSMLKNFCSSLFGPTCDMNTCPVRRGKRDGQPKKQTRHREQNNRLPRRTESRSNIHVTVGIQTQGQKFVETQKTDQHVMKTITSDIVRNQDEEEKGLKAHKEIQIVNKSEMATVTCEDCSKYCHREVQYDPEDARDLITNNEKFTKNKAVGSYLCLCDRSVQFTQCELCTCATQHVSRSKFDSNIWQNQVNSLTVEDTPPVCPFVNKKTQHKVVAEVAHKATHCTTRKQFKNSKDVKLGLLSAVTSQKPSLDSNIQLNQLIKVVQPVKEELTDTISDSSSSSVSLESDGSKTDTTICSLATMNYNDTPRRKRLRVKVITKANQATLTDKTKVCDTGMVTDDWWSPIVERKGNDAIRLEKKSGFNVIEKQKKELQELKGLKELREVRKRRNCGVATNFRNVTFRSTTQIIPNSLVPCKDILSPSRYLLESQKYYNELFACNYRQRPQAAYNVSHVQKFYEKEKNKSHNGSRRNHHHKTKRLDECYSPRRQISPRKRKTETVKTPESPRRKHRQDRQSSNRHAKNYSPRKRK